MRTFAFSVLCLFASTAAFGFQGLRAGKYHGGGEWKTPAGITGKWTAELAVTKTKTGVTLQEALTIHMPDGKTHKENVEWTATPTKAGFFGVAIKGLKEKGEGYCFRNVCHVNYGKADGNSEESFTILGAKIYRVGSDISKKESVAWQGVMIHR